jgi:phosphoribosyl-ATP pyrophosphohydrolase
MESVRIIEGRYGRLTPAKYQELARRTYQGGHLSQDAALEYHALKIIEEVQEVYTASREDRLHELGDVLWHVAGLLDVLGVTLSTTHLPRSANWGAALDVAIALGSMIAKHVGQGRELDRERLIMFVISLMARLSGLAKNGWEEVMAENILKLEKRYEIGVDR